MDSRFSSTLNAAGSSAFVSTGAADVLHGDSAVMRQLRGLVTRVARADIGVLITGETGTGKELVARCLHNGSANHAGPFIAINCAAIPHSLLENELFGHEKGAFTGAVSSQQGKLEAARGGTLFLDEIGDMPLEMQAKLLRVLQERSFERVGGSRSIPLECRIVAATHQNLNAAIKEGRFRLDLFYRLNVMPIKLPPLRERRGDVAQIVRHEIARRARTHGTAPRISEDAMERLTAHEWPGNVRELVNLIERLTVLHAGQTVRAWDIEEHLRELRDVLRELGDDQPDAPASVPVPARTPAITDQGIDLRQAVNDFEAALIRQAMARSGGVMRRAARMLRIPRSTLAEKVARLDATCDTRFSRPMDPNERHEEVSDFGRSRRAPHGLGRHTPPMGTERIAAFGFHGGRTSAFPAG